MVWWRVAVAAWAGDTIMERRAEPADTRRARGDQGTVREVGEFKQYTHPHYPARHITLHYTGIVTSANLPIKLSFLCSFDTSLIRAVILSMGRKYTRYMNFMVEVSW